MSSDFVLMLVSIATSLAVLVFVELRLRWFKRTIVAKWPEDDRRLEQAYPAKPRRQKVEVVDDFMCHLVLWGAPVSRSTAIRNYDRILADTGRDELDPRDQSAVWRMYRAILADIGIVEPAWGPAPNMDEVYAWRERALVAIMSSGLGQPPGDIMKAVERDLPELAKRNCPPPFVLRLLFPAFKQTAAN